MNYIKWQKVKGSKAIEKHGFLWNRYYPGDKPHQRRNDITERCTTIACPCCGLQRLVRLKTYERGIKNNTWTGLCIKCKKNKAYRKKPFSSKPKKPEFDFFNVVDIRTFRNNLSVLIEYDAFGLRFKDRDE